jgi:hypothetical protein
MIKLSRINSMACSIHGRNEECTQIQNLKGREHLHGVGVDGRIILKWVLKRLGMVGTTIIWLRSGNNGRLL